MTALEITTIITAVCQLLILGGMIGFFFALRNRDSSFQRQINEIDARLARIEHGTPDGQKHEQVIIEVSDPQVSLLDFVKSQASAPISNVNRRF